MTNDEIRAAAEQLLSQHLEEDCVYCDDESCLAVTVAQAVLAAQGREGRLRATIVQLLETGPDEPLMAELPPSARSTFWFCGRSPRQGHAPDCPWEDMLAFVAQPATEAASDE